MRLGIGIAGFVVLGTFFNFISFPLDWKWFLVVSMVIPLWTLFKAFTGNNLEFPKIKLTKYNIYIIIVMLIFSFSLFMYTEGAFKYPYLENDDPWGHAASSKYVSLEKTLDVNVENSDEKFKGVRFFGYLDPYPPGYSMIMGVSHQTNDSISWTLKFINALIISLGLIFFFFFMKEFTGDAKKALFSTFALSMIPAFLTHFIWAHSVVIALFFPVMYCFERIKHDKKWFYVLAFTYAGMLLVQPSQIFKLTIMIFIYLVIKTLFERKIPKYHIYGLLLGAVISLLWWFEKGKKMLSIKVGARIDQTAQELAQSLNVFELIISTFQKLPTIFPPWGGSATRVYEFKDLFFAQKQGMINNPVGIGIFLYLLIFATSLYFLIYFFNCIKNNKEKISKSWLYLLYTFEALTALTVFVLTLRYLSLLIGEFPILLSLKVDLALFILLPILAFLVHFKNLADKSKRWHVVALFWLLFSFIFINSETFNLPIGLWAFRVWMLLSMSIAIIASEGLWFIEKISSKKLGKNVALAIVAIILLGIIFTSGTSKYSINTANWPPGGAWTSPQEINTYNWMKENFPANTKVFPLSSRDQNIIGFDLYSCKWCPEIIEFRNEGILNKSADEIHSFLVGQGYEYLIMDGMSYKYLKKYYHYNETYLEKALPAKAQEFVQSGKFEPVFQSQGGIVFKLK